LKPEDSHEYDEITTQILKISAPGTTSLLNYICNKLLSKDIFPDRLKCSLIKPLYKKGSKLDMANYRPISLLTTFSKILEKVMQTRSLNHLTNCNILTKEQFVFRTKLTKGNATYALTTKF
jgi:Notch-like protein